MPVIDFTEIPSRTARRASTDTFEQFSRDFLTSLGLEVVEGPDRGADGGIDLLAIEKRIGKFGTSDFRWLVSCKHFAASNAAVSSSDEQNFENRMGACDARGFMGLYSTIASSGLTRHLKPMCRKLGYELKLFDNELIEQLLLDAPEREALIRRYFPLSHAKANMTTSSLTGSQSTMRAALLETLTNEIAMIALRSPRRPPLRTFYQGIGFSLGKPSSRLFLTAGHKPQIQLVPVTPESYDRLTASCKLSQAVLGVKIIHTNHRTTRDTLRRGSKEYSIWQSKRQPLYAQLQAAESELSLALGDLDLLGVSTSRGGEEVKAEILQLKMLLAEAEKLRDESRELSYKLDQTTPRYAQVISQAQRSSESAERTQNRLRELQAGGSSIVAEVRFKLKALASLARSGDASYAAKLREFTEWAQLQANNLPEQTRQIAQYKPSADRVCLAIDQLLKSRKALAAIGNGPAAATARVTLDGRAVTEALQNKRAWLVAEIRNVDSLLASSDKFVDFLTTCESLMTSVGKILSEESVRKCVGVMDLSWTHYEEYPYQFDVPVYEVLRLGRSMVVLGNAGAGKTTTLQMFALERLNDHTVAGLTIYVAVSRLASFCEGGTSKMLGSSAKPVKSRQSPHNAPDLTDALASYLKSLGRQIQFNDNELHELLGQPGCCLLLDGLDEGITQAPFLPESIVRLSRKYPTLQVIVSSRLSGSYLERIPFLALTLLPFTRRQLFEFVSCLLGTENSHVATAVSAHLDSHEEILRAVRNPLLATLLCVLALRDVPLPMTELMLYRKRLRLLLGEYDGIKGINRIKTDSEVLSLFARKIAYMFHELGTRELPFNRVTELACGALAHTYGREACELAVTELVDPCNVLVSMNSSGDVGFGHKRFQEHLVAEELVFRPQSEWKSALASDWWRGSFTLYAEMLDSIDSLIDELGSRLLLDEARSTLRLMIEARPKAERERLRRQLQAFPEIAVPRERTRPDGRIDGSTEVTEEELDQWLSD
jgi:hypothetical protein